MDVGRRWQVGEVILDLYEVREVVRSGGMGLVYRVHHRGWNVELAVKTPRPALLRSPGSRSDFEREAESWVGLGLHPHTVNCAYVRTVGDLPAVFAEWVDGGDLADEVRTGHLYAGGPRRALSRILDVAVQLAWGLDHAHSNGLVHQDMKPANAMITGAGMAKVTDFGLARARAAAGGDGAGASVSSLPASYGGLTPAYCSPEQARGARLTRATDVWSWALTVLEMFTGGPPATYGQDAAEALAAAVRHGPPNDRVPALPDALADLLRRCFQPEPSARPSRMDELAHTLIGTYTDLLDETYPRERAEPADLIADSLSNQALSMLDLGHVEQAERLWDQALRADPQHVHAIYNRGLLLWRAGKITDAQLVAELEVARAYELTEQLLTQVQLERGAATFRWEVVSEEGDTLFQEDAVALSASGNLAAVVTSEYSKNAERWEDSVTVWDVEARSPLVDRAAHAGKITAVVFTSDDRLMISASEDRTVLVRDVSTGRRLHRLDHASEVRSVAVAGNGDLVVSAALDGALLVWDLRTGQLRQTLRPGRPGTRHLWSSVAVTEDGGTVITSEYTTHALHVWETATGRLVRSTILAADNLNTATGMRQLLFTALVQVAPARDGKFVLAYQKDQIVLRDTATGQLVRAIVSESDWYEAALSGNGRWALSWGLGGVQLWEMDTGRCLHTLRPHTPQRVCFALSADGSRGLLCSSRAAAVWDLSGPGPAAPWSYARPRTAVELTEGDDLVSRAIERARGYAQDGRLADAAATLREARGIPGHERDRELLDQWTDLGRHGRRSRLREAWVVQEFETGDVHTLGAGFALSADGRQALIRSAFWSVDAADPITGVRRHKLAWNGDAIRDFALSRNGLFAVTSGEDKAVRVWDLADGHCRHVLTGHRREALAVAISATGGFIASGGMDGTVKVWESARGRRLRSTRPHRRRITSIALSADGRFVLTSDHAGDICVRDMVANQCRHVLPDTDQGVGLVALGPDSRTALSPSADGNTLRVTDLATGELRHALPGHPEKITSVAISADSTMGFSGGHDSTVRVWDLVAGQCVAVLTGHADSVWSLAPSSDGRVLLSAAKDGTLRIWDLADGHCLGTLDSRTRAATFLAVDADARIVMSGGSLGRNRVRLWELDWDYEFDSVGGGSAR